VRLFALTVPGIGPLLRRELAARLPAGSVAEVEHDGRSDVVPFSAGPAEPVEARLAEDLFVEIGAASPAAPPARLAGRLWSAGRYDAALGAILPRLGRLGPRPGFRVVVRLRSERDFLRTELREALTAAVLRERPRWRVADPADVELWALQTRPGRIRLGVRLSDRRMRQRAGRAVERPGALRPVVAAAMLSLAAPPGRPVLDPCCGAGTIVGEALREGRAAIGSDLAADAVAAARANLPAGTPLLVADATALPLGPASVGAVVSNLPFGGRYRVERPAEWLPRALREFERVVAPGGAIVLLAPPSRAFEHALGRLRSTALRERHPLRLLGMPTTLWALRRAPAASDRATAPGASYNR
jgi:SAM-dependent methyltransferase